MKITVLNDNRSDGRCLCEHGLSMFIENNDGLKILFDAGPSDVFLKNAETLGVNLDDVNCVVLSHGHWDHGNGLEYVRGRKLICHPSCFIKRYRVRNRTYIGLKFSKEAAEGKFDLILSKEPRHLSKSVIFLGEIPRINAFESRNSPFLLENNEPDFVPDDSALAITSDLGLIVISGCAHSGICNTVEYAKKVTGIDKVYAVAGGFHLKSIDDVTLKTVEYFKKNEVKKVFPCHCVEDEVIKFFAGKFGISPLIAGNSIDI